MLSQVLLLRLELVVFFLLFEVMLQEVLAILQSIVEVGHSLLGLVVDLDEAPMHVVDLFSAGLDGQQQTVHLATGLLVSRYDLLEKTLSLLQIADCMPRLGDFPSFEVENTVRFLIETVSQVIFESHVVWMFRQLIRRDCSARLEVLLSEMSFG